MKLEFYNKHYVPQEDVTPPETTVFVTIGENKYQLKQLGDNLVITTIGKLEFKIQQSNEVVIK